MKYNGLCHYFLTPLSNCKEVLCLNTSYLHIGWKNLKATELNQNYIASKVIQAVGGRRLLNVSMKNILKIILS